jgi:Tfp pilus assembly protein PilF
MISCKDCATPNSLDSAFCKKCGKPLAQEEALDARETLEKQLDHGFELFHHGRTDEAWLNVETCLVADPENLRAHSLKGMILERRGLIHEAIGTYEFIVAKDPKAALERMKLQALRGLMDAKTFRDPMQQRRTALGVAVCAGLFVFATIGAIMVSRHPQTAIVASTQPGTPNYKVDSFTEPVQAPITKQVSQGNDQASDPTAQDGSSQDQAPASNPAESARTKPNGSSLSGQLPDPSHEPIQDNPLQSKPVNPFANAEVKPVQTNAEQALSSTNTAPANHDRSSDPDPSTVTTPAKATATPPVVDIKLSEDRPKDSDLAIDANGVEAMVRAARGQYQVGHYEAAASTYERALSAGADPAMTNQRLAQCYERLGRTSDAKSAYSHAITAIQTQINGGRGNKDRLMAALNSSQQALKNLQGG